MRATLLQVKEELGADAVIMSNKKVAGGVEIVAAIDSDAQVPAATSVSKQVNRNIGQSNRYDGYRQMSPATEERFQQRGVDEDKITLSGADGDKPSSMTQRFANILKQYNGPSSAADEHIAENEDSLSALLHRQNKHRENYRHDSPQSAFLQQDSPLAKLIAQDSYSERKTPKLDPTRYERGRSKAETSQPSIELENMHDEMVSIRRLLEHQVSGLMWQEVERREPLRAMLIKRLERMGMSSEFADQMACYIPEDTKPALAWKALLSLVADQISIPKQDILKRGGVVALLGPTGVGKTTTVAKLAARAAMEYGADNVALVTTDTYRIGAHEQLSIYGRIMGCPVRVAKDSQELADVIYQLRNRKLILVDTAGMGQRDVRLSEQLDTLMHESGEVIHSYLVLPATAQRRVLQETLEHFRRIPLSGCILTKLDESLSLGEFISVVIQNAMPVAYIANGQRVPEDIVMAQPKYMVAKANELLEMSAESEPHFWNSDSEGL
ncbi:flagellar biosynthesis regulator FlhF [Vibrio sagamiensis NBRC 104589]|uniref:Flagellar biosynthesis protein FlhF n=2 Tax=Vibrio sagamiensis TaxID=512650 RepID=A0A511QAS8_9VIBR|nr:flagellar biosynthesis regulator FlhF [Vibrio sagamiensis NBRC 104589]